MRGMATSPSHTKAPVPPALVLIVAVFAMSWAAPLIRFATAPALVISAWRLTFSALFIALVLTVRRREVGWGSLSRGQWSLGFLAGVSLAGHFWSWIAAVQLTTVASAAVLVAMQPFFVALLSLVFLGERPTSREWTGIVLAVAGAVIVGWGDLALGGTALLGDGLALLGGLLMAVYLVVGRSLRRSLELWSYIGLVYGVAAGVLVFIVLVSPSTSLVGYPRSDWLIFLALAAGPMMIGHTGMNYAVRYTSAFVVNLAALAEPVGSTLIAWLLPAIREVPGPRMLVGGAAILLGIAVGLWPSSASRGETPPPGPR